MKRRIAKKIIQGRSNICITEKRAFEMRAALAGTEFYHVIKTIMYGYLYGASLQTMKNLTTKE